MNRDHPCATGYNRWLKIDQAGWSAPLRLRRVRVERVVPNITRTFASSKRMEYDGRHHARPQPERSISERLQLALVRAHIYLQGNIPLAWMLTVLVFCSVLSQIMIMMLSPSLVRDPTTDHWLKFKHQGKRWRAPVIVYQVTLQRQRRQATTCNRCLGSAVFAAMFVYGMCGRLL